MHTATLEAPATRIVEHAAPITNPPTQPATVEVKAPAKSRAELFKDAYRKATEEAIKATEATAKKLAEKRDIALKNGKTDKADKIKGKQETLTLKQGLRTIHNTPEHLAMKMQEFEFASTVQRIDAKTGQVVEVQATDSELVKRAGVIHTEQVADATSQFCKSVDTTEWSPSLKVAAKVGCGLMNVVSGTIQGFTR